jgi:DNA repair photolyase
MSRQAVLPLVSFPASVPAPDQIERRKPIDPPAARDLRLRRTVRRGRQVSLGIAEAPYAPGADVAELTALRGLEGLEVAITTQSPAILEDLEQLVELDRRCSVTVDMVLAAVDPFLVRRLEPGAADARSRLRAVAGLAAEGIAVRLLCTPLCPGLNDREPALRALLTAAREAGALDVLAGAAPQRVSRLARLLGRRAPEADLDPRLAVFRRLKLEFGFPRLFSGRG